MTQVASGPCSRSSTGPPAAHDLQARRRAHGRQHQRPHRTPRLWTDGGREPAAGCCRSPCRTTPTDCGSPKIMARCAVSPSAGSAAICGFWRSFSSRPISRAAASARNSSKRTLAHARQIRRGAPRADYLHLQPGLTGALYPARPLPAFSGLFLLHRAASGSPACQNSPLRAVPMSLAAHERDLAAIDRAALGVSRAKHHAYLLADECDQRRDALRRRGLRRLCLYFIELGISDRSRSRVPILPVLLLRPR